MSRSAQAAHGVPRGEGDRPVAQSYLFHRALFERVKGLAAIDAAARAAWLAAAIEYAVTSSPFYRDSASWRSVSTRELEQLPFTTRQDVLSAYPFGLLAVRRDELVRYAESTGTAGPRGAGYVTREDWLVNNLSVSASWASFLTPDDTLAVAVPYELTYVGADIDRVAELLGAAVLSIGVNNQLCPWRRAIELLRSHAVTAVFCSPTRAIRLAQLALEAGLDPRWDLQVRKIICVGELTSDVKRDYLAQRWNASVYDHYGMTEVMAVAVPCARRALHLCEDRLHVEVVDPLTNAPVPPGTYGELVLTTLANRAMPLVRYRTGDLIRVEPGGCPCGSRFRAIKQLGRVSGVFATPAGPAHLHQVDEILLSEPRILPYYAVSRMPGGLRVSLAVAGGARSRSAALEGEPGIDEIVASVRQRLVERFGVEIRISLEDEDQLLDRIDNSSKPGTALRGEPDPTGPRTPNGTAVTRSGE